MLEGLGELLLEIVLEVLGEILSALLEGSIDLFNYTLDKITAAIYPVKKNKPSSDYPSELRATSSLFQKNKFN